MTEDIKMHHLTVEWATFFGEVAANGLSINGTVQYGSRFCCLAFGEVGKSIIMVVGTPSSVTTYINAHDHATLVYGQPEVHCKGFIYAYELADHMDSYRWEYDKTSIGVVNLLTNKNYMVREKRKSEIAV
jgi:hypothetical protein